MAASCTSKVLYFTIYLHCNRRTHVIIHLSFTFEVVAQCDSAIFNKMLMHCVKYKKKQT